MTWITPIHREIMDEIAAPDADLPAASSHANKLDRLGSIQWPCNDAAPEGTPIMHIDSEFVRGKGKFINHQIRCHRWKSHTQVSVDSHDRPRAVAIQNVGAQTRRTDNNVQWHAEDRLEIHPHDAEERGIKDTDWVGIQSRAGDTVLRAMISSERMQPGVGLHDLPLSGIRCERDHEAIRN